MSGGFDKADLNDAGTRGAPVRRSGHPRRGRRGRGPLALVMGISLLAPLLGVAHASAAAAAGGFTSLTPARLLDTRIGVGAAKAKVGPDTSLTLRVAGVGGVPASGVVAVTMNLTATDVTQSTSVTAYPAGTTRPTASNVNVAAGQTAANAVVAEVGAGGSVALYNHAGSVDLIADVSGYWTTGSDFTPLPPSRLLDTRLGVGAPVAKVGNDASLALTVAGRGGVPPSGVDAVVLNVTATDVTSSSYVTVYPAGASRPTASNLNMGPGQTVPNLVVVQLGAGGAVDLYNRAGTVDLIADVAGYWASGGSFTSLLPVRLADTRVGLGSIQAAVGPRGEVDVQVAGRAGVPSTGVGAVILNVTAVAPTTSGYVSAFPASTTPPTASILNLVAGQTRANLVFARLGAGGRVRLYNSSGKVALAVDISGWFPGTPAPIDAGQSTLLSATSDGLAEPGTVTPVAIAAAGASTLYLTDDPGQGGAPQMWSNIRRDPMSGVATVLDSDSAGGYTQGFGMSADGRFEVLGSLLSLVANDGNGTTDVYRRDLQNATIERVSSTPAGAAGNNGAIGVPVISATGRFVAFTSDSSDLLATPNFNTGLYIRDMDTGTTTLVSRALAEPSTVSRRRFPPTHATCPSPPCTPLSRQTPTLCPMCT